MARVTDPCTIFHHDFFVVWYCNLVLGAVLRRARVRFPGCPRSGLLRGRDYDHCRVRLTRISFSLYVAGAKTILTLIRSCVLVLDMAI